MKVDKLILDSIERCYCAATLTAGGTQWLLLAGEAEGGPCYAYSVEDFSHREVVWEHGGGTMAIVQIPGRDGEFVAIQNFFPGFRSETAKLVRGKRLESGVWQISDIAALPYVHRFDPFSIGGTVYILACVLCGSKRDREDWSDPGFVAVGSLPEVPGDNVTFTPILTGLTKNHGYFRGRDKAYIACEEGLYSITPPDTAEGEWGSSQILSKPVSDLTLFDLDGDGLEELVTIEPFHGDQIQVYHLEDNSYSPVYTYPTPIQFAHALMGCTLCGLPCVVCGIRRCDAELSLLRCVSSSEQRYEVERIDTGVGPSNVAVVQQRDCSLVLSANHTKNEGAVYIFHE